MNQRPFRGRNMPYRGGGRGGRGNAFHQPYNDDNRANHWSDSPQNDVENNPINGQPWRNTRNQGNGNQNNRGNQRKNARGNGGQRFDRPRRKVGFKYIEELVNLEDVEEILSKLKKDQEGFNNLLYTDLNDDHADVIVLIVKLIAVKLCHGSFDNIVKDLLTVVFDSDFPKTLLTYINGISFQRGDEKFRNKHFWNNTDEFWNNILHMSERVLEIMPSVASGSLQKILKAMELYFPEMQKNQNMKISEDVLKKTESLQKHVEDLIKQHESEKSQKKKYNNPNEILEDPPEDFRDIPVIPAALEVTENIRPYLRPNVIDRPYDNVNHYLDIQFRLLREDFVNPLRKGIVTYLQNQHRSKEEKRKLENIKVYPQIQFLNEETVNECSCYKIQYDPSKKKRSFTYENSRRFMFGSLVCFTRDNFQTLLFGKIVQRDPILLEKGMLIVGFQEDQSTILFDTNYVMVESSVYFEPYYQVLNVLKKMKPEEFPMERYIIKIDKRANPPEYIIPIDPVIYEIEDKRIMPIDWPENVRFYGLNDSQLSAFESALTQEFCIIQGPPGTGKTFLGLKIAQTLLENRHAWFNRTPMLVICFTNHALDQFLEGLLPVTNQILRIGGQSKNEKLNEFNIRRKKTHQTNSGVFQARKELQACLSDLKRIDQNLNHIFKNDSIVSFKLFQEVIENYRDTWFYNAKSDDIKKWLLEGRSYNRANRPPPINRQGRQTVTAEINPEADDERDLEPERHDWYDDDIYDGVHIQEFRALIDLNQLMSKSDTLKEELLKLRETDDFNIMLKEEKLQMEIWEIEQDLTYLERKLGENMDRRGVWDFPEFVDLKNPWRMTPDQRWHLYFHWVGVYYKKMRVKHQAACQKHKEKYRVYNDLREIDDLAIMKSSLVIGMTTTGAARLQSSLQALRSPIVIVEEAAEVLEAHIVAALTYHCQHLILIGDHEQLKPTAADFKIETDYQLGISLFERMVLNDIQCHTLNVQHRMRPEISRLIKPVIYPNLHDHETTLDRPPILGVQKSVFFLDHQEPEDLCQDNSKKNVHESKFVIALARHLVLNGYKPEQITILAAYLGQMFEMMREKKKPMNEVLLRDVRIAVLDNYQGEESDIILLSLVRNNPEKKIGFLKTQNRVCVALSRARDGLYITGNMQMLCEAQSENNIWDHVKKSLEDQNAVGPYLSLKCQIHHEQITQVSKAEDFRPIAEGGCSLSCESQLACGHICKRMCHVQDRTHQLYKCREVCNRPLCDSDPTHLCKKLCSEDCGPCTYKVTRTLPECHHTVQLSCYIDINNYNCKEDVWTKLPCDHEAWKPCSADPETFRCPHPCNTRVEPCGHKCDRQCHIRVDPDHLQYRCMEPCARPKVDCQQKDDPHICNIRCFQQCEPCDVGVSKTRSCGHFHTIACKLDVENIECKRRCKLNLPCGHKCKNDCFQPCGPCNETVEKIIKECGHKLKRKCSQEVSKKDCNEKNCPVILPCGHKCKNKCRQPCTAQCKEMVDCALKSPCGHIVKKISCHLRYTNDPDILLKNCSEPCKETLKCMHKCSGSCGECLQGRIHKRCGEKCGVPLVCNHECPNPCREACRPCIRPCQMECCHSKCKKKCGEPCTDCVEPCARNCPHKKCRKQCGQICDIEPCTEKCTKILQCGHQCVGFCNDPCPNKCRVCDKDELTEVFFGTEDDEDAIFVMLTDCEHIFESSGLDYWIINGDNDNSKDQQIQSKVCPKCKTNITKTERYSTFVKRAMRDVMEVKKKAYGNDAENKRMRKEILEELKLIMDQCPVKLKLACPQIDQFFNILHQRLQPSRKQRRQPINLLELYAINTKLQTVIEILGCFKGSDIVYTDTNASILQLSIIVTALVANPEHISKQEKEDIELETKRLERIIQLEKIENKAQFKNSVNVNNRDVLKLDANLREVIFNKTRYNDLLDKAVKCNLTELNKMTSGGLALTDRERKEIVKALQEGSMGVKRGSWFKCANGHYYVIGDCGGATQFGKCNECGVTIGGEQHRVVEDSRFAPEMDEAVAPAWPGVHY